MRIFKKQKRIGIRSVVTIAGVAAVLAALAFSSVFSGHISGAASSEGLTLTERAIRRAVVQCYAVEGFYPESLSYLEDNYGLIIDHRRYFIHYSCFASNLPPDVTVLMRD